MTAVTTWVVDCRDGVCIERGRPSTASESMAEAIEFALTLPIFRILLSEPLEYGWWFDQPEVTKAIHINTNFQDVVTGIRDADVASESLIDDMMTGVRDVGGTAGPGDTGSNVNNPLDQMGFTNLGNDVVTNDLQTSWQGSVDKMPWDFFRPAEGNAKETGELLGHPVITTRVEPLCRHHKKP